MSAMARTSSLSVTAALLAAVLSSGCYELTVRNGLPIDPVPAIHDRFTGGFVNGLIDEEPVLNPNAVCPSGWAEIHYKVSFLNGLLNGIRGLIYESTSVTIHCASRPLMPPPGPVILVTPPPPPSPSRGPAPILVAPTAPVQPAPPLPWVVQPIVPLPGR
jgi:Bor protein